MRTGVRLEIFTVAWMAVEAVLAIGAGIAARSVLLSGVTLLWCLSADARGAATARIEGMEHRATQISAALLVLLCGYLVLSGVAGLLLRLHPEGSVLGVATSAAAVVLLPLPARRERRVN